MASRSSPPLALPPSLSPDDLDVLSELSIVLAKVRAGLQSSQGLTTGATPRGTTGTAGSTIAQHYATFKDGPGATPRGNGGAVTYSYVTFKDVPGATDKLKHRLQQARAQVCALPDMERTIEEQEIEMSELEARIVEQRALLERLRDGGVGCSKDSPAAEDKMEL